MAPSRALFVFTVSLLGLASAAHAGQPLMSVDPDSITFEPQQVGSASLSKLVTINNDPGASNLSYTVSLSAGDTADFLLLCLGGGVACLSGQVNAAQSASVYVAIQPTATGHRAATLTVTGNDFTNPSETVDLDGTAFDRIFANGFDPSDLTPWSSCIVCVDNDPPATIVDLSATSGIDPGTVDLSWTAPAEDSTGFSSCTAYEVRYSVDDIVDANSWDNANFYSTTLVPGAPESGQFLTLIDLVPGQFFYFAVRALDEVSNEGALGPSAGAEATPN